VLSESSSWPDENVFSKYGTKFKEYNMGYYFTKKVDCSFEDGISKVVEKLKAEGFGILTEIDVKDTLKKKIDVDFYKYRILGACNPQFAYKALQAEDKIGAMLPCNIIVQQKDDGSPVEISAVDPVASMQAVSNENLHGIADEVRNRLKKVIDSI
jgi:uncharacterized protein (DUF302 family)